MAKKGQSLRVHGLIDLQKELRDYDKALPKRLRVANLAAAEVIAEEARERVPEQSGRLRRSTRAKAQQRGASVTSGSKARVPYAGPVHWGWNSRPQGGSNTAVPYISEALDEKYGEMKDKYRQEINDLKDDLNL